MRLILVFVFLLSGCEPYGGWMKCIDGKTFTHHDQAWVEVELYKGQQCVAAEGAHD